MLPEDDVLLTYILKQNREDSRIKSVNSSTRPEAKVAKEDVDYMSKKLQVCYEYGVDILISSGSHKISENLQKFRGMKEVIEDTLIVPSTSSPVVEDPWLTS